MSLKTEPTLSRKRPRITQTTFKSQLMKILWKDPNWRVICTHSLFSEVKGIPTFPAAIWLLQNWNTRCISVRNQRRVSGNLTASSQYYFPKCSDIISQAPSHSKCFRNRLLRASGVAAGNRGVLKEILLQSYFTDEWQRLIHVLIIFERVDLKWKNTWGGGKKMVLMSGPHHQPLTFEKANMRSCRRKLDALLCISDKW